VKSCPSYHGHGNYGNTHVFGCLKGYLTLTHETSTNTFTSRQIKYHDSGRTSNFFHHDRQPVNVGQHANGSKNSLIRWTAGMESLDSQRDVLDFGDVRLCSAGFELALGQAFVTLLVNGSLMVYDVSSGWMYRNSVKAADASSVCSGAGITFPRMALGYHRVFLLFPDSKKVFEYHVSLSTLTRGRTLSTSVQVAAGVVSGLDPTIRAEVACSDGVVLNEVEKAAVVHTAKETSNSSTKSPACRLTPGGGERLLLSAYVASGLASLYALYSWSSFL